VDSEQIDELMRLFDRYMASGVSRHRDELRTALEAALKPDPSCDDVKLAEKIMSDCGHSTNNTRLLERITNRIAKHTAPPAQPDVRLGEVGSKTRNPKYPWKPAHGWDNCPKCFEDFSMEPCDHCGGGYPDQYLDTPPAQTQTPPTYSSTQATKCAGCGEHKHTPLRIDAMGGYVCLTCIDQKLGSLLGEFGHPAQNPPRLSNGEIYTAYIEAANQTLRPQDERIALGFAQAIESAVRKQAGWE
jgi:ribosomal protein L32